MNRLRRWWRLRGTQTWIGERDIHHNIAHRSDGFHDVFGIVRWTLVRGRWNGWHPDESVPYR